MLFYLICGQKKYRGAQQQEYGRRGHAAGQSRERANWANVAIGPRAEAGQAARQAGRTADGGE